MDVIIKVSKEKDLNNFVENIAQDLLTLHEQYKCGEIGKLNLYIQIGRLAHTLLAMRSYLLE